eukprot:7744401-Pyramimonas_sp.AAC.1
MERSSDRSCRRCFKAPIVPGCTSHAVSESQRRGRHDTEIAVAPLEVPPRRPGPLLRGLR